MTFGLLYKTVASVTIIAFCFLKCSTDKTPDNTPHGEISYSLNWDQALAGGQAPQALRYCFYPKEGGAMIQIEGKSEGLQFTLPPDKYSVLIFNSDVDNIKFHNMESFDTAEAYLPQTKAGSRAGSGITPLYGIAVDEINIESGNGEGNTQEFTPKPLVRQISLNINVSGMEYVDCCKGSMSGIPAALNLSKQVVVPESTTSVDFEATPSAQGVNANVMILGTPPQKGEDPKPLPVNEVKLDFTLNDGSTASTNINLGSSVTDTDSGKVDVDISVTVAKEASFTVTVNKWEVTAGDDMVIE